MTNPTSTVAGWNGLNRLAFLSGVLMVLASLADMVTGMVAGASPTGGLTPAAWMELLQKNPWLGLQGLSFPQLLVTVLGVPFFVALYGVLRRREPGLSLLGLVLILLGAGLFVGSNSALPMLELSARLAAAADDGQRSVLLAAAAAVLARGTDFTPSGCLAFLLPSLGGLLLASVMARTADFGRWLGWTGVAAYSLLLLFVLGASFAPGGFAALMPAAALGGLASMVWNLGCGFRLWNLQSRAD